MSSDTLTERVGADSIPATKSKVSARRLLTTGTMLMNMIESAKAATVMW